MISNDRLYFSDNHIKIYNGDCRDMSELPDESVQCVVTSPPYFGLRKYSGLPDLVWGGKKDCEHQWSKLPTSFKRSNQGVGSDVMVISPKLKELNAQRDAGSNFCSLCGAWKGSLGLEPEPDCGRPYLKLKDNLTDKQREYVMSELERLGAI